MAAALDADRTIRLWKRGERYHAAVEGVAVFGNGASRDEALADLDRRFAELQAFGAESGLALDTLAPARRSAAAPQWRGTLIKAATVVVCFWLMMIPLSYALSTALERTVLNLHINGGSEFWHGVEEKLIELADPKAAPPPEQQAKILAAVRTLVQRWQPYADEAKPLFGCDRKP
ncbi:MAG TPA: hypothetical protein VK438_10570 [Xanthobacteraceae bacterium]|nr:hypothetical protein [Xanthobacteraceae bacterium]